MAAPADISSILAALAQRNASTPSQPTPAPGATPTLPPGFPGAIPQQAPTPSLPGFSLPQPTSSGSVDLSAIRPSATGSVSIAEAIAKAKSIAADRGVSYDNRAAVAPPREDPRLAGRGYRRSRSRSRSPPRRDAFRDNYNPYRDERRDNPRRGSGYGRDRTPSPGPRGRNSFSPGRGRRSPPARGGGDDSETISVKSALVGLIIGRAGENLRRVESETGARVQFIPAKEPNAPNRQCTISGPMRARDAAKSEIFRVIEENGGAPPDNRGAGARAPQQQKQQSQPALREGENSIQIWVPDKTVGLIIGRGGETIRDLQEKSGCHVNIVGENKSVNGQRPVNLIGSQAAADRARAMIAEIVESDTRTNNQAPPQRDAGRGGYGGGGGGHDSYRSGGGDRGDDGKVTETIQVPSEAVGMIIGKGGETIKEMQNVTGCKINVNQPKSPDIERDIGLVGSRRAVEDAKRAIWEKVDTVQQRDSQAGRGRGGRDNGGFGGDRYSQPQQPSFGQLQQGGASQGMPVMPTMPAMPAMAGMPQAAPPSGDSNAPDPYAAYGGYQNYVALWYAALAAQGQAGQAGQPPPGGA
ncbi:hypothetical protein H2203_008634 [Taxawa tesnikishii (nom. ined.)]|nr:hypothetical protein H2203_008634 [Dothideales sp. JES 119]